MTLSDATLRGLIDRAFAGEPDARAALLDYAEEVGANVELILGWVTVPEVHGLPDLADWPLCRAATLKALTGRHAKLWEPTL